MGIMCWQLQKNVAGPVTDARGNSPAVAGERRKNYEVAGAAETAGRSCRSLTDQHITATGMTHTPGLLVSTLAGTNEQPTNLTSKQLRPRESSLLLFFTERKTHDAVTTFPVTLHPSPAHRNF